MTLRGLFMLAVMLVMLAVVPDDTRADEAVVVNVEIKARKVVGAQTVRVHQGDEVELRWRSDERAELHLHGYDIESMVDTGQPVAMKFTARATGRFPVTSHGFGDRHGHAALLYLEVLPR